MIRLSSAVLPDVGATLVWLIEYAVGYLDKGWSIPKELVEYVSVIYRSLFGVAIVFLYLFEALILLVTLRPLLVVEEKQEEQSDETQFKSDPADQFDKTVP